MSLSLRSIANLFLLLVLSCVVAIPAAVAQGPGAGSLDPTPVAASLDQLDGWLGNEANGDRWREYLGAADLRAELAKGAEADPAVLAKSLRRLSGDANGLKLAPFQNVRTALGDYLATLRRQYGGDFAQLAAAASDDHTPLTPEQFAAIRSEMRTKALALEQALGRDSSLARNWKKFLKWDLLTPHFEADAEVSRRSLANLDEVLLRFHANEPGLELPVFTDAARAIAKYRALASWAAASKSRDVRADYERLLSTVGADLKHHQERPTTETGWKVGRVLGVIDSLGHSADFVDAVRGRFAQKNITATASSAFIEHMPNRSINQVRPVRDCILGTSIFGSAHTMGNVRYELLPSPNSIELAVYLNGRANSRTNGYNGPVRINSQGLTTYAASKRISISDDLFAADPAVATVNTRTHINSINKTGGQFAANLIEKVAWKRALQSKSQAERISAEHTRQNVINEFNERVAKDLGDARLRYQTKIRDPLVRRDVKPEYLLMSSSPEGILVESIFAGRNQLAADSPPPATKIGNDLVLQVHESAVNNYLPLALASARISQETADQKPLLDGNVPNWIKALSVAKPKLAAAAATGAAIVEGAQKTIDQVVEGQADERPPGAPPALPPFKPYSVTLNPEAPVGIRFEDGSVIIRIRASKLVSDDIEYSNWDFIITYAITHDADRIILKRVGDIEVFPTGFDPAWDKQLTAQQSGFRSTLAKNMNARAKAGESFPAEIPIDPIRITNVGTLLMNELESQDGWLTIGWILPPPGQESAPVPVPAPAPTPAS